MGRKKQDREDMHARVAAETPEKLKQIALALGYTYAGKGSTGKLLDAIADGKLILIAANTPSKKG